MIRLAKRGELSELANIWLESFRHDGRKFKKNAKKIRITEYNRLFYKNDQFWLVYLIGKTPVAYIHFFIERNLNETKKNEDAVGWIRTLAVSKKHRENGIGKKLICRAESFLKKKMVRTIYVKTKIANSEFFRNLEYDLFAVILKKTNGKA